MCLGYQPINILNCSANKTKVKFLYFLHDDAVWGDLNFGTRKKQYVWKQKPRDQNKQQICSDFYGPLFFMFSCKTSVGMLVLLSMGLYSGLAIVLCYSWILILTFLFIILRIENPKNSRGIYNLQKEEKYLYWLMQKYL